MAVAFALVGCTDSGSKNAETSPKALGLAPILSKSEAELRYNQVSEVNYNLTFDLNKESKEFKGSSEISFKLNVNFE